MTDSVTSSRLRFTLVFILVVRASHDAGIGAVNIPFPFRIGNTELNDGHYIVRLENNHLKFTIKNDTEEAGCAAVTAACRTASACGTLAFVECGRRYLLCKAFWPSECAQRAPSEALARIQECGYQIQASP